jgi:hypothetical protein
MNRFQSGTEEKILLAAKEIFVRKGFDAVRMEEIAHEAGVNKSALHYYFRSKEKLFEAVFDEVILKFISEIGCIWIQDIQLPQKIEGFVSNYIDLLSKNPHIPLFVLYELNRKPERAIELVNEFRSKCSINKLTAEKQQNRDFKDVNLIITLLSLCTLPFICRPFICKVLFNNNTAGYNNFLHEMKKEVSDLIIQSFNKQ